MAITPVGLPENKPQTFPQTNTTPGGGMNRLPSPGQSPGLQAKDAEMSNPLGTTPQPGQAPAAGGAAPAVPGKVASPTQSPGLQQKDAEMSNPLGTTPQPGAAPAPGRGAEFNGGIGQHNPGATPGAQQQHTSPTVSPGLAQKDAMMSNPLGTTPQPGAAPAAPGQNPAQQNKPGMSPGLQQRDAKMSNPLGY